MITQIVGRELEMDAYFDSRTLIHVVTKYAGTTEKRLQIYIAAQCKSYERGDLSRVHWMPGKSNPDDTLSKAGFSPSTSLWRLMQFGAKYLLEMGWAT